MKQISLYLLMLSTAIPQASPNGNPDKIKNIPVWIRNKTTLSNTQQESTVFSKIGTSNVKDKSLSLWTQYSTAVTNAKQGSTVVSTRSILFTKDGKRFLSSPNKTADFNTQQESAIFCNISNSYKGEYNVSEHALNKTTVVNTEQKSNIFSEGSISTLKGDKSPLSIRHQSAVSNKQNESANLYLSGHFIQKTGNLLQKSGNVKLATKDDAHILIKNLEKITPGMISEMRKIFNACMKRKQDLSYPNAVLCVKESLVDRISTLHTFTENSNNSFLESNSGLKRSVANDNIKAFSKIAQTAFQNNSQQKLEFSGNDTAEYKENRLENRHTTAKGFHEAFASASQNISTATQNYYPESVTSCENLLWYDHFRWLLVIVECPTEWSDQNIRIQCETWEKFSTLDIMDRVNFLPVQSEMGIVYANVNCAICHGVDYPRPWTASIICNNFPLHAFPSASSTNMAPLFAHLATNDCQKQIIPAKPEAVEECAEAAYQVSGFSSRLLSTAADASSTSYPMSFDILINFDFAGNTNILFSGSQQIPQDEYITRCQEWETFDPYIQTCRSISCSEHYILVGNTCVQNSSGALPSQDVSAVPELHTHASVVHLVVNITFGDFLFLKLQDPKIDVTPQLADRLNVSADRIKDVNITYDWGSSKVTSLQVVIISNETYSNLFENQQTTEEAGNAAVNADKTQHKGRNAWEPARSQLIKAEFGKGNSDLNLNSNISEVWQADPGNSDANFTTILYQNDSKFMNISDPKSSMLDSHKQSIENVTLIKAVKTRTEEITRREYDTAKKKPNSSLSAVFSGDNLSLIKKSLKQAFKQRGMFMGTPTENFFYRISKNADTDLYISSPFNSRNERIGLLIDKKENTERLVEHAVKMKISFLLTVTSGSGVTESEAENMSQKIHNLTSGQQFVITVNGYKIQSVGVNNDEKKQMRQKTFCSWGIEYYMYGSEFTVITLENKTKLYVNKTNTYFDVGMFDLYMMVSGNRTTGETRITENMHSAFVCIMPRIIATNCTRTDVQREEYNFTGENKSIIFEGNTYDMYSYQVLSEDRGTLQICVPLLFEGLGMMISWTSGACSSEFNALLEAESYLTLVLSRISIVALSLVFLTYILFAKLRSLPGLNIMSLTFSLLVSQLIFSEGIAEKKHWLCQANAVCLHYMLLSAHFWMNVISYDTYKTFANSNVLINAKKISRYFPRYAIYSWGTPFVVVSACIFIEFSGVFPETSIGYGSDLISFATRRDIHFDNDTNIQGIATNTSGTPGTESSTILHSCWISQPLAALLSFGAIVLIIFLVNSIFFGITIRSINKTVKVAKEIRREQCGSSTVYRIAVRSEILLYARMSTVMGFTWVFGLSSSIVSSFAHSANYTICLAMHVLTVFFIIFSTSQGVFIFIAFVCNRRIFGLCKGLMRKAKLFVLSHNIKSYLDTISSNIDRTEASATAQSRRHVV